VASKERKVSDKELVRTLFSKQVRKALKKMLSTMRTKARAKRGKKKR
jgi:hypothetical protein